MPPEAANGDVTLPRPEPVLAKIKAAEVELKQLRRLLRLSYDTYGKPSPVAAAAA